MKKTLFALATAFLCCSSFAAAGQNTMEISEELQNLAPGLYIEQADGYVLMSYEKGVSITDEDLEDEIQEAFKQYSYKGKTSANVATGSFILVRDPKQKSIVEKAKKYYPFVKTMTPDNIMLVPLKVKKRNRIFEGLGRKEFVRAKKSRATFDWEQLSDNIFHLTLYDDTPAGEYAFVFRLNNIAQYYFTSVHSFSLPE